MLEQAAAPADHSLFVMVTGSGPVVQLAHFSNSFIELGNYNSKGVAVP